MAQTNQAQAGGRDQQQQQHNQPHGAGQQDQQSQSGQQYGGSSQQRDWVDQQQDRGALQFTSVALRGVGQVYDINLAAARVLLQTQARAAAAFGWPDFSELFNTADRRTRGVFSSSAEQILHTARRASEAASELQRQLGRVVETQAVTVAENWQRGLEEIGQQADESLTQLSETVRQQAEEARRATESLGRASRESVRQGSEQWRESTQEGFQRSREVGSQVQGAAREGVQQGHEQPGQQNQTADEAQSASRRSKATA